MYNNMIRNKNMGQSLYINICPGGQTTFIGIQISLMTNSLNQSSTNY